MYESITGLLGLMRRASALILGEDGCVEAVSAGKARLLLLPSDASDKKTERAYKYTNGRSCQVIRLPFDEKIFSAAIGKSSCTMAAITDIGFADALLKQLQKKFPDVYDESAFLVNSKFEKIKKRKYLKPGIKQSRKKTENNR